MRDSRTSGKFCPHLVNIAVLTSRAANITWAQRLLLSLNQHSANVPYRYMRSLMQGGLFATAVFSFLKGIAHE
jgi:hypothetical protein